MATENEHRQQALRNAEFLATIERDRFPDWWATVAFYQAVHLVEMLFAHDGRHPGGSHTRRNNVLKLNYPEIWKEYRPLYAFSRLARYHCMGVEAGQVSYIERRLRRLEQLIAEAVS